ncbi:uncharacterized protein EV420DRAFT_1478749 [Desarmillaria tabescens]|uniref:Ubiquitin-like protease family profile domain-containing protein n=1 Tax=Armillaria tabescens TaxID=1929756 RepID=A0AA39N700_ARMTA|nr:uncharacterized protein EV420DRAFT_1478749 [Desarmillaria tabescens]KAK0460232.1 hypothetical protein EV420DRAFT_1478749 [Desarmillaria tabescens]
MLGNGSPLALRWMILYRQDQYWNDLCFAIAQYWEIVSWANEQLVLTGLSETNWVYEVHVAFKLSALQFGLALLDYHNSLKGSKFPRGRKALSQSKGREPSSGSSDDTDELDDEALGNVVSDEEDLSNERAAGKRKLHASSLGSSNESDNDGSDDEHDTLKRLVIHDKDDIGTDESDDDLPESSNEDDVSRGMLMQSITDIDKEEWDHEAPAGAEVTRVDDVEMELVEESRDSLSPRALFDKEWAAFEEEQELLRSRNAPEKWTEPVPDATAGDHDMHTEDLHASVFQELALQDEPGHEQNAIPPAPSLEAESSPLTTVDMKLELLSPSSFPVLPVPLKQGLEDEDPEESLDLKQHKSNMIANIPDLKDLIESTSQSLARLMGHPLPPDLVKNIVDAADQFHSKGASTPGLSDNNNVLDWSAQDVLDLSELEPDLEADPEPKSLEAVAQWQDHIKEALQAYMADHNPVCPLLPDVHGVTEPSDLYKCVCNVIDNNPTTGWHFLSARPMLSVDSLRQLLKVKGSWLNDDIVNVTLRLLCQEYPSWGMADSLVVTSKKAAPWGLKALLKEHTELSKQNFALPVHHDRHWVLFHLDFETRNTTPQSFWSSLKLVVPNPDDTFHFEIAKGVPQQHDSISCGVYTIAFAWHLMHYGVPLSSCNEILASVGFANSYRLDILYFLAQMLSRDRERIPFEDTDYVPSALNYATRSGHQTQLPVHRRQPGDLPLVPRAPSPIIIEGSPCLRNRNWRDAAQGEGLIDAQDEMPLRGETGLQSNATLTTLSDLYRARFGHSGGTNSGNGQSLTSLSDWFHVRFTGHGDEPSSGDGQGSEHPAERGMAAPSCSMKSGDPHDLSHDEHPNQGDHACGRSQSPDQKDNDGFMSGTNLNDYDLDEPKPDAYPLSDGEVEAAQNGDSLPRREGAGGHVGANERLHVEDNPEQGNPVPILRCPINLFICMENSEGSEHAQVEYNIGMLEGFVGKALSALLRGGGRTGHALQGLDHTGWTVSTSTRPLCLHEGGGEDLSFREIGLLDKVLEEGTSLYRTPLLKCQMCPDTARILVETGLSQDELHVVYIHRAPMSLEAGTVEAPAEAKEWQTWDKCFLGTIQLVQSLFDPEYNEPFRVYLGVTILMAITEQIGSNKKALHMGKWGSLLGVLAWLKSRTSLHKVEIFERSQKTFEHYFSFWKKVQSLRHYLSAYDFGEEVKPQDWQRWEMLEMIATWQGLPSQADTLTMNPLTEEELFHVKQPLSLSHAELLFKNVLPKN